MILVVLIDSCCHLFSVREAPVDGVDSCYDVHVSNIRAGKLYQSSNDQELIWIIKSAANLALLQSTDRYPFNGLFVRMTLVS